MINPKKLIGGTLSTYIKCDGQHCNNVLIPNITSCDSCLLDFLAYKQDLRIIIEYYGWLCKFVSDGGGELRTIYACSLKCYNSKGCQDREELLKTYNTDKKHQEEPPSNRFLRAWNRFKQNNAR